eukprot:364261-Chlamydomonas_euryale.AAC.6
MQEAEERAGQHTFKDAECGWTARYGCFGFDCVFVCKVAPCRKISRLFTAGTWIGTFTNQEKHPQRGSKSGLALTPSIPGQHNLECSNICWFVYTHAEANASKILHAPTWIVPCMRQWMDCGSNVALASIASGGCTTKRQSRLASSSSDRSAEYSKRPPSRAAVARTASWLVASCMAYSDVELVMREPHRLGASFLEAPTSSVPSLSASLTLFSARSGRCV